ncbi:hypothetical protein PAL_GLEAN10020832 [Pteropus alecto]|uniref:Uncharacterized protein n=1 Tax=Pteropus alecto TaxID=9402 RepID=L5JSJ8_PTEAL|nr:hypothetical protein PAL_GLEAN10020832 [Pteropus alecto]
MNIWRSHGSTNVLGWRFQTQVQARAPPLRANTWHGGRSQQTAFRHPGPGTHVDSHFLSKKGQAEMWICFFHPLPASCLSREPTAAHLLPTTPITPSITDPEEP